MTQATLFGNTEILAPATEGIKYAGSKLKFLKPILQLASITNSKTVFDGFAGTTRVSQAFAKTGYDVICNDISAWSKVFGTCYLKGDRSRGRYDKIIGHLNSLDPVEGWYTELYGGPPNNGCAIHPEDGIKRPWQIHNTVKLDAIRQEIDRMGLDKVEKCVALTSLILAMDKVDSTLGHYVSYLKDWAPRSYNNMYLTVPALFDSIGNHKIYQEDVFDLIPNIETDLAYLDPPYGSNNEKMPPSRVRYASYYHIWTTICLNDKPDTFGKAYRRADSSDKIAKSVFEEFRKDSDGHFLAVKSIDKMIKNVRAKWVILSYSSGGRATAGELVESLETSGEIIEVIEIDYKKNVMSDMRWTNKWVQEVEMPNREFLFLLKK